MKKILLAAGIVGLVACTDATSPNPATTSKIAPVAFLMLGNNTVVVTEADIARQAEVDPTPTSNWVFYNRTATSSGAFIVGPASPPLGIGSFSMQTPTNGDKGTLFNFDHVGTSLQTITGMSYSTYKAPGSSFPFPSINIQIDINGGTLNAGEFRTFVFEPYFQPGFVDASGVWETRNAYNGGAGKWWSTQNAANLLATGGARGCGQSSPCTWSALLAAFPGATIVGGFGINAGSGNAGLDGSVDALSISYGGNSVTYDFEPYAIASSKEECKNGGWTTVKRADGTSFRNQGDCVSYVNAGR